MEILLDLSALALKQVVDGVCTAAGYKIGVDSVDNIVQFLAQHFTDHSRKLAEALKTANNRAWKALELALAGESWWTRCQNLLASTETRAFKNQVRLFLDHHALSDLADKAQVRQQCWRELRAASQDGLLTGGRLDPHKLAERTGSFLRFSEPERLLDAEWEMLNRLARTLAEAGYTKLGWLVALRPDGGVSLLASAARYFFRREVETDQELFQGLAFAKLETLGKSQEQGFTALHEALSTHGERLEALLQDVHDLLVETHDDVLDIKVEMQRQGQQLQDFASHVLQALEQHQLSHRELRASDSLSIHSEPERQLVKMLVLRYRALPEDQRRDFPALLHALAKLEVAAGEFDAAQRDFGEVAALVGSHPARAEAHYNAYQTALERGRWDEALDALLRAVQLDAERYAPFPLAKYDPERILGAGGFGVAFLCRNRHSGARVVIKVLRLEGLEREVDEVFAEARVLEQLEHPAIIRLRDCDYGGAGRTRPFLVMDYFEGRNLADHVERQGPVPAEDLVILAQQVAEGLHAAHRRGILHRDVKPANLLVRRDDLGCWHSRLIDFGLALKQNVLYASLRTPTGGQRSTLTTSVAGTLDYAAPEQLGRLAGSTVGPRSDIYGFARTCCYALFQTTHPLSRHWQEVPRSLALLLEECLEEKPERRPRDFAAVLESLRRAADEVVPTVMPCADSEESPPLVLPADPEPPELEVIPIPEEPPPVARSVPQLERVRRVHPPRPVNPNAVVLRLIYRGDWFPLDARVAVWLDGRPVGEGSVIKGFTLETVTEPGNHQLQLHVFLRTRYYFLQLPRPGIYEVRLVYDRMWATFADNPEVKRLSS